MAAIETTTLSYNQIANNPTPEVLVINDPASTGNPSLEKIIPVYSYPYSYDMPKFDGVDYPASDKLYYAIDTDFEGSGFYLYSDQKPHLYRYIGQIYMPIASVMGHVDTYVDAMVGGVVTASYFDGVDNTITEQIVIPGSAVQLILLDNGTYGAQYANQAIYDRNGNDIADSLGAKQDYLPILPETGSETKFLNEKGIFTEISGGTSSFASNIYASNTDSATSGYKKSLPEPESALTSDSVTATTSTVTWGTKYLYDLPVGVNSIDAGTWQAHLYCKVSSVQGITKAAFRVFRYTDGGQELFTDKNGLLFPVAYSGEINAVTDYSEVQFQIEALTHAVDTTDRIGVQIGIQSDVQGGNKTLTWWNGNGYASHITVPVAIRHDSLRGKNDNPLYQHITSTEKAAYEEAVLNATTYRITRRKDEATTLWTPTKGSNAVIDNILNKVYTALFDATGNEVYKLNASSPTFKSDGVTPSVLTGADGNVMVVIPAFWYKWADDALEDYIEFSETAKSGFTMSPSFAVGKYLADVTNLSGGNVTATSRMRSVSGVIPSTNLGRSEFRTAVGQYGAGTKYQLLDYEMYRVLCALVFAKIRNTDTQAALANGVNANADNNDWIEHNGRFPISVNGLVSNTFATNYSGPLTTVVADWYKGITTAFTANKVVDSGRFAIAWNAAYIGKTIKNLTTNATATITAKDSNDVLSISADIFTAIGQSYVILSSNFTTNLAQFCGISDLFGHIWSWIDGVNVNVLDANRNGDIYVKRAAPYTDNVGTPSGYTYIGKMATAEGFIRNMYTGEILPKAIGGASNTFYADYHSNPTSPGWRAAAWGGYLSFGSSAGLLNALFNYWSGDRYSNLGARLALTF
jgi:hypothetical protein